MGSDFNIRPAGSLVSAPVVKPQPDAAKHAVATELSPSKATTAADTSIGIRNNARTQYDNVSENNRDRPASGCDR